jgi:acyl-CoA synthetase (AMP-forming)/AMP-acid ligase II
VRPGGAAAFGVYDEAKAADLVVIVCETRETDEAARAAVVAQVSARVSEHCGVSLDEVVLVAPGSIPKTSSGKRQRPLCRELYLAGELGRARTGKLRLAMIFVRSGAGFLVAQAKRLVARQREPA